MHHAVTALTVLTSGLLLAATVPAAAAGKAQVNFIEPQQFTDAGRNGYDRDHALKSLGDYMQSLGARLPDGQTLNVDVTDVDLAGELRPWRGGYEVRVLRGGADWPHLNLRWSLQAEGRTLKSGEARLADPNYLFALRAVDRQAGGDLVFEKRMLRTWFEATFERPERPTPPTP